MASIVWYCLLAVIGVGVTVFTLYKKRDKAEFSTYIVFFLFATAVTWIGEFVVLGLFDSYAYKTGIFHSPWAQNLLGHIILNSTFYPGTALLVAAYSLGYGWMCFITTIYLLAEILFLKLGIYEHHWWRNYMTGIAIFVYQIFTKAWFERMKYIRNGWFRTSTFYLIGFVILHYPVPILLLLGKQFYNVNLTQDIYLSSTIFIFTYQLVEAFILVFCVCVLKQWYWKVVPFIVSFIGQIILVNLKILVFHNGWSLFYTLLIYFICITTFMLIEKHSLNPRS